MPIKPVSDVTIEAIRKKSVMTLPDNPSKQGYTPDQIKKRMSIFVIDNKESIISEINRVVDETNQELAKVSKIPQPQHVGNEAPNPDVYTSWIDTNTGLLEFVKYDGVLETGGNLYTFNDPTPEEPVDTDGVYEIYIPGEDLPVDNDDLYELESTGYDENGNYIG